jgi:hypothetical protein
LEKHRKEWSCPENCPTLFKTADEFAAHLTSIHIDLYKDRDVPELCMIYERPANSDTKARCPFCSELCLTLGQTRAHIGRHLVALALFVIPYHDEEDSLEPASERSSLSFEIPDSPILVWDVDDPTKSPVDPEPHIP